jgi:hypothetical protein
MTNFVVDKAAITKKLLSIIRDGQYTQSDLDLALFKWWSNIRNNGGLKLTDDGHRAFNDAGLEHFDYPFVGSHSSSLLLKFDRYMPCPYHLSIHLGVTKKSYVRVYDSRIAMLIGLHGTVIDYVDSLDIKRTDLTVNSKL